MSVASNTTQSVAHHWGHLLRLVAELGTFGLEGEKNSVQKYFVQEAFCPLSRLLADGTDETMPEWRLLMVIELPAACCSRCRNDSSSPTVNETSLQTNGQTGGLHTANGRTIVYSHRTPQTVPQLAHQL